MPCIELLTFTASEKYLADQGCTKGLCDLVGSTAGCQSIYYGLLKNDKTTGVLAVVWDSYEDHKRLQDSPGYPKVVEQAKEFASGNKKMEHITVKHDPTGVLAAPVTLLSELIPKKGKEGADINTEAEEIREIAIAAQGVSAPPIRGEVRESPGKVYSFTGLKSVEAYHKTVNQEKLKLALEKVEAVFERTVNFATFKKHV